MVVPSDIAREVGLRADMIAPPHKAEGEVEGIVAPQVSEIKKMQS